MRMPQMHSMCTDIQAVTHMCSQSVCMHHKHTNTQTYVNTYNTHTHTHRTMSVVENDGMRSHMGALTQQPTKVSTIKVN